MVLLGVLAFLAGLGLFAGAWWAYSRRRHIMDTPTSKVRSMAVGRVELFGVAAPAPGRATIEAPFTGAPCLYWEYEVEEQRTRRTKNGTETYWATLAKERSKAPIGLRDDTGTTTIDAQGGDLPTTERARFGSGWGKDPPDKVLTLLQSRGIDHETLFGINKKMRFSEGRLVEGAPLFVHGNATRREDAVGVGHETLVVQREGEGPFLVSAKSEKQVLAQWTTAFWGMLVGGIALAGLGAFLLWGVR